MIIQNLAARVQASSLRILNILRLALLATVLVVGSAHAQTFSFSSFDIRGNQRVEDASILTFAGIAPGQRVTAAQVNAAAQRILESGLFESVDVVPAGRTLVIDVVEFPTINVVSIEGNRRLSDEQLRPLLRSAPRRVFSPAIAEADAGAIVEAYQVAGRLGTTVEPRIIRRSDNRVDLVFEVVESRVIENERISFVGNRAYSERRLRRVLETKQAGFLRQLIQRDSLVEDRLQFDQQLLSDFYLSRGFIDFQVLSVTPELSRERNATFITFTIREGQSFRFGEVTTESDLPEVDPDAFLATSRIRSGNTYSPIAIENTIARMERLAIEQGLNFVRVTPRISRNDRDLTLDVTFVLERGERIFVERIDIEGNQTTLDRVVRRQFRIVEGDPFNPREIRQAAERIRALGFFGATDVQAREGSAPDRVIVDVDVEETTTGSLAFGGTYSVADGVGLAISFTERNFLGRGQTLGFTFSSATDNAAYGFNFVEPALLGRDLRFGFRVNYAETTSARNQNFDTQVTSFRPELSFPISERGRLAVRYTYTDDRLFNVDTTSDDATEPFPGSSAILVREEAQGGLATSALGYSYSFDNRRTGLNPNAGVLFRFNQDFAGVGGDTEYIKTSALISAETRVLREEVTLRAELEGGALNMISGDSRIIDRFSSTNVVRGFAASGLGPRDVSAENEDALGGNFFAVARLEAEFPLGLPEEYGITGGVFLDYGSVWGLDDKIGSDGTAIDDSFIPRGSVGFSIFWTTPIGPLRFNFSSAFLKEDFDEEQTFDLTVQTRF